jgi:hypothetical protein
VFFRGFWEKSRTLKKGGLGDAHSPFREISRFFEKPTLKTLVYIFCDVPLGFLSFQSVKLQLTYTYIELKSNAAWFDVPVEESEISLEVDGVLKAALLKHCSCFEWYAWYNNERITISFFVF